MKLSLTLLGAALAATLAEATTYNLLHRISSFDSSPEWTLRGTFELPTTTAPAVSSNITATSVVIDGKLSNAEVMQLKEAAYQPDAGELWYQVAIAPSTSTEPLLSTSVRLCHLRQSHPDLPSLDDELALTTRNTAITGLSYRILDITLSASSCPLTTTAKMQAIKEEAKRQRQRQLSRRRGSAPPPPPPTTPPFNFKTQVVLKEVAKAPVPGLKQALPTNEDGTVVQPVPEKSFLQKYWFYLIPIAILLIMPAGDEDKGGAEGHASSEHVGTGQGAKRLK